jgi:hypothetical protein
VGNAWRKYSMLTDDELDFLFKECSRDDFPEGDVLMAGVYQGGDVIEVNRSLFYGDHDRNIIVLDSFQGLAAPRGEDLHSDDPAKEGECDCGGIDVFLSNIASFNVKNVSVFKMWIDEKALEIIEKRPLSFIWLDVDHYAPTLAMMNKFWSWLTPGGRMVSHDFDYHRCPGIKAAADKFGGDWKKIVGGIFGIQKIMER